MLATSRARAVDEGTVGTTGRLTGWETKPVESDFEKQKIKGEQSVPPWRIADTRVRLAVRNSGLSKSTLLYAEGCPAADVPVNRDGTSLRVELPAKAVYLILH